MHEDKGELHGITVVVDTVDDGTYVGRCFEANDRGVVLLDADRHVDDSDGPSREEYLRKAAMVGHWARIKRVVVPPDKVVKIERLAEVAV